MDIVLIILLILLLFGGIGTVPVWSHSANFGYGPSGLMFVLVIVLLVYLIRGQVMFESALLSAVVAFIKALFGGKQKDPETVEAEKNEAQAQKAEAVFAAPDRNRAAVDDILRQHSGK